GADALDHDDMAVLDGLVEVLSDADHPGRGDAGIGNDRDEVHGRGNGEGPDEIGRENGGALEDAAQVHRAVRVVLGDARAQTGHLELDGLLVEEDVADLGWPHRLTRPQGGRLSRTNARDRSTAAASARPVASSAS